MLKRWIPNYILRLIVEWIIAISIAISLFLIFNAFVLRSSRIDGSSMEPSYFHNDRVFINLLTYFFSEPRFGDVVAFPFKEEYYIYYIKRIIGTPDDIVDFKDGFFYVNNQIIDNNFSGGKTFSGDLDFPIKIPQNYFFVLGDNRDISLDSRFKEIGNIHRDIIIGRVNFRWFPFSRFGFTR